MTSNVAEQVNAWIMPLRRQPIVAIMDGIYRKVMEKMSERRSKAMNHRATYAPKIHDKLVKATKDAKRFEVAIQSHDTFTGQTSALVIHLHDFVGQSESTVSINWNSRIAHCDCLEPQDQQLPCKHVIATSEKVRMMTRE